MNEQTLNPGEGEEMRRAAKIRQKAEETREDKTRNSAYKENADRDKWAEINAKKAENRENFKKGIRSRWDSLKNGASNAREAISNGFESVVEGTKTAGRNIIDVVKDPEYYGSMLDAKVADGFDRATNKLGDRLNERQVRINGTKEGRFGAQAAQIQAEIDDVMAQVRSAGENIANLGQQIQNNPETGDVKSVDVSELKFQVDIIEKRRRAIAEKLEEKDKFSAKQQKHGEKRRKGSKLGKWLRNIN